MKVGTILDQIDLGSIALPEFQRGYVWNRNQVKGLMDSLYHKHPVGSLLVWVTKTESADTRGDGPLPPGTVKLLLDGQQRATSLYGIVRGNPPPFFYGNPQAFTGLYFNLENQAFEFYAPIRMRDNPLWISVTEIMQKGLGHFIGQLYRNPELEPHADTFAERLNSIGQIKETELHIEEVTGEDKTVDVVVDIFNRVNSGGTKLSKGDLALAKICAQWPEARNEMKARLDKWRKAGFDFKLEWFLRCINTTITGEALFGALDKIDTSTFSSGLQQAEKAVDNLLNLVSGRLGLDHDRVLGSRYSFPLLVRYLADRGGHLADYRERDHLLYWYIHSFLWGRYAGSTETVLNQDLAAIEASGDGLNRLVNLLRQNRGDLRLNANDFTGWSTAARFYPLLYMLTRVHHARDWDSGIELSNQMLGKLNRLQVHHIFPKSLLYQHRYSRADVNAIGNFTFLTQETNLKVSNRGPSVYLEEFAKKHPGAVESHWIPLERELWKVGNYREFLAARRELLAKAANEFLDSLLEGSLTQIQPTGSVMDREAVFLGGIASEEEQEALIDANIWITEHGFPEGEFGYELTDEATGKPLAVLDLAWPTGLQEGYSQPVALLMDGDAELGEIVNRAGFRFFTDPEVLKKYVRDEVIAQLPVAV
jgi:hypothetical protein